MNQLKLVLKSIRYYFWANLWTALGVAITTAVLTGGLIVGDSVKYSLEQATHLRLGEITHALTSGDRYFTLKLGQELSRADIASSAALKLEAVGTSKGGQLSLNRINVWGIDKNFAAVSGSKITSVEANFNEGVHLNETTALRLNVNVGDDLLLKIEKASLIPANAPFVSDEERYVSYRTKVAGILGEEEMGRLNLQTSQTAPFNVFLPIEKLNSLMELENKANVLLISTENPLETIQQILLTSFSLEDVSLKIGEANTTDEWELTSERVFIDDNIIRAVENTGLELQPILTYFTNSFRLNERVTPYSFISTVENENLDENEIIINSWLAKDLNAYVGDSIQLAYYNMGLLRELSNASKSFLIKEIVPIEGYYSDQSLMPNIPGLSDSESCKDWQTGVPVDLKAIRDTDEEYWYQYRGLPKAFVRYETAQSLWKNRYGSATALRFSREDLPLEELNLLIKEQINPFELDFQLRNVKGEGVISAQGGTDFSQLFIGLSFFILVSGILLTTLLFRYSLEKRSAEIGTLSSLGFSDRKILSIFLHEGVIIARTGAALGILLAIGYNKMVFWGLNQVWNDIVRTDVLVAKVEWLTLLIGFLISLFVSMLTIYFTLKKKLKQRTVSLQRNSTSVVSKRKLTTVKVLTAITLFAGLIVVLKEIISSNNQLNAGAFFMAGGLLLIGFVSLFYFLLLKPNPLNTKLSLKQLVGQNIRNNRTRSLTVVSLLAIGTYLVVSTGLNRQDLFSKANDPTSGTGGYLFWAETTIPVLHNLNNEVYRTEQGFSVEFNTVQMHVAEGDDASCLNLNLISAPRVLGLDEALLQGRFSLQTKMDEIEVENFWNALSMEIGDCIPAIADQTVIQWGLGKKVGDTLLVQNSLGEQVKLILIAGLKASVFQGSVMISQQNFIENFPTASGTNVFLVGGKTEEQALISDELDLLYRDYGIELQPAAQRLAEFKSVENTYLSIFLVLGALGLLIGTIGLGIVLQRSMLERKSEFALLSSVGFKHKAIGSMVIFEYLLLLVIGLLIGFVTAVISVYPVISSSIETISLGFVGLLIAVIFINALCWIVILTTIQLKNLKIVQALRND